MSDYFDVVIAGGGIVGVSLALQLGAVLPREKSILLVESFTMPAPVEGQTPDYHPAFDARSTALSYSSRLINPGTLPLSKPNSTSPSVNT